MSDAQDESLEASKVLTRQGDTETNFPRGVQVIPYSASLQLWIIALELSEARGVSPDRFRF